MIGYEIIISVVLLLIAILLIILTLEATKKCSLEEEEIQQKMTIPYQDTNYEVITQETRPENGGLAWDNGKELQPLIIPVYNPEDYYTDYYNDYYQGVINKEKFQDETEMPSYSKLDDVLYENQIDVLLKSTSQVFQDQQIKYLEDEITQLEQRT